MNFFQTPCIYGVLVLLVPKALMYLELQVSMGGTSNYLLVGSYYYHYSSLLDIVLLENHLIQSSAPRDQLLPVFRKSTWSVDILHYVCQDAVSIQEPVYPTVINPAANMTSPLPLQLDNPVDYRCNDLNLNLKTYLLSRTFFKLKSPLYSILFTEKIKNYFETVLCSIYVYVYTLAVLYWWILKIY